MSNAKKKDELILENDFASLFFYYICMNHEYLSKPFIEFFRVNYNINGNQMAAIGYLKQSKSMTMGELASKMNISKQQTTQLVNSLVCKNLVSRKVNEQNRREIIVKPTEYAINLLIDGENIFLSNALSQITKHFDGDTDELTSALQYLSDQIPQINFSMDNFLSQNKADLNS